MGYINRHDADALSLCLLICVVSAAEEVHPSLNLRHSKKLPWCREWQREAEKGELS